MSLSPLPCPVFPLLCVDINACKHMIDRSCPLFLFSHLMIPLSALEIALKFKCHVDTVRAYRKRHLEMTGLAENLPRFLTLDSQMGDVDWEAIKEEIRADKQKESERPNARKAGV